MELREFEAFLTVAETLHFGRAAERLGLSQARVSQLVRALEHRVGAPLFTRTSRRVALTPLGEHLRASIAPPLDALTTALAEARSRGRSLLRVGHLPNLAGAPLTELAEAFESTHPGCEIRLTQVTMDGLREAWDGGVDITATFLPVSDPALTIGPEFARYGRLLAIATGHPLATAPAVVLEDLADLTIPEMPSTVPRELHNGYWPPRTPSGREIRRTPVPGGYTEALHRVARGELVLPVDEGTTRFRRYPGVTFLPITDLPPARAVLTWRTAHTTALITAFAATVGAATRKRPTPPDPRR